LSGDGSLKYKIKNWLELSIFTENLGKMLNDGLMFDNAFNIARKDLCPRVQKFNRSINSWLKQGYIHINS